MFISKNKSHHIYQHCISFEFEFIFFYKFLNKSEFHMDGHHYLLKSFTVIENI